MRQSGCQLLLNIWMPTQDCVAQVRKVAEENGVDVSASIAELEGRARQVRPYSLFQICCDIMSTRVGAEVSLLPSQLRKETYSRLTPVQRLQVARHPNRPTCLDIILNITDKFVELHGDRAGLDDPAIVCGIGSINGTPFMMIGHQKGRNTKVRPAGLLQPPRCMGCP